MTENKGDLISRETLKKQFANNCLHNCYYCKLAKWDKKGACYNCGLIDNAPTVEARPQGNWKHIIEEDNDVECPFCGFQEDGIYYNYCPNCGADMRGDKNEVN